MIRLIALDLDGTLLDSDKNFPEGFPAWVKSHPDINVCLASGRQLYTLMQQFSEIADRLWYIAENGAVIGDAVAYRDGRTKDADLELKQTWWREVFCRVVSWFYFWD